jgi:hypothetical protein
MVSKTDHLTARRDATFGEPHFSKTMVGTYDLRFIGAAIMPHGLKNRHSDHGETVCVLGLYT